MLHRRLALLVVATVAALVVAGCSEKIEAGAACPQLCPSNEVVLQDTTLDAVVVDTTIAGFPPIGDESYLLLANRGDTLDTRVIARYDSLPNTYRTSAATADSTIRAVDSAEIRITVDTLHGRVTAPVTIEAYDVGDTTTADTVASQLLPYFSPDRLLGSRTFAPESIVDSIAVPISNDTVLAKLTRRRPLRVGFRLRSASSQAVRFYSSSIASSSMQLRFRVATDTTVPAVTMSPRSLTPSNATLAFLRGALGDFVIVAKGPPPPPPGTFSVGGMPGARAYVRFDIPRSILDSTRIVRATLLLTEVPNGASPAAKESLYVQPLPLLVGKPITDIAQVLRLASSPGTYGLDSTGVTPLDTGVKRIQLVPLVQRWAFTPSDSAPRAIALRASTEGATGAQVLFYSLSAPPDVRPRLRLTYVPHVTFGLP